MSDKDRGSDVFDMIDRAVSFYEKNKETFEGVVPGNEGISINDDDPLKQAMVDEDKAMVTVDVGTDELEDIRLALNGTTVEIGIGADTIMADVPADVDMDDASARLNNGILEVEIPRVGGDE